MAWVPGGTFRMGSDAHYPEEAPARPVAVDGFWIDRFAVTTAQFAAFVARDGVRDRGRAPARPRGLPGRAGRESRARLARLHDDERAGGSPSHAAVVGVDARRLLAARERDDHPVVHVACEDAEAYAAWAGKALPTEAEWECAARGGIEGAEFVWGDEPEAPGERLANFWHGDFPWRHDAGYGATAAVGSFPPNGLGLHEMAGNVWEWTADWYVAVDRTAGGCCVPDGPRGATAEDSFDPAQPQFRIPRRVVKGGSFLCADSYCRRYRPAARRPQMVDSGMSHIGFRCVVRS